ncbi:AAA family ATPase [Spiroplasma endosymbiont of Cantharis rufa]|uniref:AAA family ATPase n=1 Tax=Spiroplasma endosymbiont of Cantharis rufa TaxID=3066279 RepID=UPI0030D4DA5D
MIKKLEISNYKKFDSETFIFEKNNLLIGDNDSGKSSILEALELFFNKNEISSDLVIDINKDIVITIMLENDEQEYTKIFKMSGKTKAICKEFNYKNLPRYVYIRSNDLEIDKKVSEILSINFVNQLSNETKDNIQVAFKDSIQLFFNSINDNLNVVNGFDKTKLDISETLNYEKLVSFKINDDKTNIVPLKGRGSGFIKNLLYLILVNNTMNEFIIGIDEIENSFSLKNVENLIETLLKVYKQTIISTHISSVYEITNNLNYKTIPLHSEEGDINLFKLIDSISHKREINILLL